jgi:predicted amidophosphoribosyltransferase
MSILVFLVLAAASAAAIAYPLLPGRAPAQSAPAPTAQEIEQAVRELRRSRRASDGRGAHTLACPSCDAAYQDGDLFCVRCGAGLPQTAAQSEEEGQVCSHCGASLHEGDQFCAKCGKPVATEEVA